MTCREKCLRKPAWLKVRLPGGPSSSRVRQAIRRQGLHSVCQEAHCPNMAECFDAGTATFLILGNICTRNCLYCNVGHGIPLTVDEAEPARLAAAVRQLNLLHVVITSVTRDDLPDGGASLFAAAIEKTRAVNPQSRIEALISDLKGNGDALMRIVQAQPDIISHNIEAVPRLFPALRPQGSYSRSLQLLRDVGRMSCITTKSGFMVGFGETISDIRKLFNDLYDAGCRRITIGQYQQPSLSHWPVRKYYHPEEFAALGEEAKKVGFELAQAGPLVRSSYRAAG